MTRSMVKTMKMRRGITRRIYMVRRSVAKAMRVRRGTMKINGQRKSPNEALGNASSEGGCWP